METLLQQLPLLLAETIKWAKINSDAILLTGMPLSESDLEIARSVGVKHPEKIRVKLVDRMPMPIHPVLTEAIRKTNLMSPYTSGMTLGYGIYVRTESKGLLSHECRHVFQYENADSLDSFLTEYLTQILNHGYFNSALEKDAYAHTLPLP